MKLGVRKPGGLRQPKITPLRKNGPPRLTIKKIKPFNSTLGK